MPVEASQHFNGISVSPGIAIGRAVCVQSDLAEVYRISVTEAEIGCEVDRLRNAIAKSQEELEAVRRKAQLELGGDLVGIFEAQALLLSDKALIGRFENQIANHKVNAEWAVVEAGKELDRQFQSLDSPQFRERSDDVKDVIRHILRCLQGNDPAPLSGLDEKVVIVAHDLTPSEALRLGRGPVTAFLLETGGQTSHTAIIARALRLPLISGLHDLTQLVVDDDPIIVNGAEGEIILHPTAAQLEHYKLELARLERKDRALTATRKLEAVSRDGEVIQLLANIELPEELDDVRNLGAAGIGLYRSEFLYIEKSPNLPTEEDHFQIYKAMIEKVDPLPVVVRTFDLGGRKLARELLKTEEDNPVLGLRGIRLTLARPDVFVTQMRALLRAGLCGDLRVMLPMISTVSEIRQFRSLIAQASRRLDSEGIEHVKSFKLGIMIEVPAAAVIADCLAPEVDFFSIGTNDLIQYALAVDRNNEHVAYLYQPFHPAILRMVDSVVRSAEASNIEVSLCGEMASDPECVLLLLGLGLRRLSLSPRAIPVIKEQIRKYSVSELTELSKRSLLLATAEDVRAELAEFVATR